MEHISIPTSIPTPPSIDFCRTLSPPQANLSRWFRVELTEAPERMSSAKTLRECPLCPMPHVDEFDEIH